MKSIVFDCEKMRYPNTGFYFFCKNLAANLAIEAKHTDCSIAFYAPKHEIMQLGSEAQCIIHAPWHRYFFPMKNKIDIWHSATQMSRLPKFSRNTHVVLTIHDLNILYEHAHRPDFIKKQLSSLQCKINRADQIVTISEYVKNDILNHLNVGGKPVHVIYNGCNIPDKPLLQPPKDIPKQPFLFAIGAINAKKNFHVLTNLLLNTDYNLIISGITDDPDYREQLITEAKKINASSRVFLTGAISDNDKYWYFQNCTAFVFPSLAEGFGLPVIEAMYFGKPVFLSKFTSLPEIGGEYAFYFNSFDAEAMQATLEQGLAIYHANTGLAEQLQQRAKTFNWRHAAAQYLQLYQQL